MTMFPGVAHRARHALPRRRRRPRGARERWSSDQIAGGIDGLVPVRLDRRVGDADARRARRGRRAWWSSGARGRVPVIAGTGSNSTAEAIRLTRGAEEAGADAALLISPYYNKPTQDGIYRHYAAIAEATALPLIVYNIPGRTGVEHRRRDDGAPRRASTNIVGVKEATGSLDQVPDVIAARGRRTSRSTPATTRSRCRSSRVGGTGVISVVANVVPAQMVELADACRAATTWPRARDAALPAAAAHPRAVPRDQSDPGQGGAGAARLLPRRAPPAADAAPEPNREPLRVVLHELGLV